MKKIIKTIRIFHCKAAKKQKNKLKVVVVNKHFKKKII